MWNVWGMQLYGGVRLYHAPAFYYQWITFFTRLDLR